MVFKNDKQRRAVMSKISKSDPKLNIKSISTSPMYLVRNISGRGYGSVMMSYKDLIDLIDADKYDKKTIRDLNVDAVYDDCSGFTIERIK